MQASQGDMQGTGSRLHTPPDLTVQSKLQKTNKGRNCTKNRKFRYKLGVVQGRVMVLVKWKLLQLYLRYRLEVFVVWYLIYSRGSHLIYSRGSHLICNRGRSLICVRGSHLSCNRGSHLSCNRGRSLICVRGSHLSCNRGSHLSCNQGSHLSCNRGRSLKLLNCNNVLQNFKRNLTSAEHGSIAGQYCRRQRFRIKINCSCVLCFCVFSDLINHTFNLRHR